MQSPTGYQQNAAPTFSTTYSLGVPVKYTLNVQESQPLLSAFANA